jgi:hypothetical protein
MLTISGTGSVADQAKIDLTTSGSREVARDLSFDAGETRR